MVVKIKIQHLSESRYFVIYNEYFEVIDYGDETLDDYKRGQLGSQHLGVCTLDEIIDTFHTKYGQDPTEMILHHEFYDRVMLEAKQHMRYNTYQSSGTEIQGLFFFKGVCLKRDSKDRHLHYSQDEEKGILMLRVNL